MTEGEIQLNGVNIKEYDYDEYMKLFAVVFQDYRLFAFSMKENILLKEQDSEDTANINYEADNDYEELVELCKVCGLEGKIASLEKGIDTTIIII